VTYESLVKKLERLVKISAPWGYILHAPCESDRWSCIWVICHKKQNGEIWTTLCH